MASRRASKRRIYMRNPKTHKKIQRELGFWAGTSHQGTECSHHFDIFPRAGRPRFRFPCSLKHFVHGYFLWQRKKRKSPPISCNQPRAHRQSALIHSFVCNPTLTITFWVSLLCSPTHYSLSNHSRPPSCLWQCVFKLWLMHYGSLHVSLILACDYFAPLMIICIYRAFPSKNKGRELPSEKMEHYKLRSWQRLLPAASTNHLPPPHHQRHRVMYYQVIHTCI